MNINRTAIKSNAKITIRATRPSPILVGLVFIGIALVLQFLSTSASGQLQYLMDTMNSILAGVYDPAFPLPTQTLPMNLITLALSIMSLTIGTGFTIFCLNAAQERESSFGNLFDGFTIFWKLITLTFMTGIFVWLWSLLLIIPGIIASYRYRMAVYVLIDNPHLGIFDCINESKRLMDGRKGELFTLDLSFIGWHLLTVFPFVAVWVTPYTSMTYANYYLALRDMPTAHENPSYNF